jgi:putative SOS response-associated peptidase YedK
LRYAIVDGMNVRDSRVHNYPARWNAAPSQELLVIRRNHNTAEVSLDPLRWGLIPYWCQDPTGGRRPINAKCETVRDLPSFRDAYRRRRCIVPVDGFFEWKAIKGQKAKQPYAIAMKDGAPSGLPAFGRIGKSRPQAIGLELSRSSLRMPMNWLPTSTTGCLSSWRQLTMRAGLAKSLIHVT